MKDRKRKEKVLNVSHSEDLQPKHYLRKPPWTHAQSIGTVFQKKQLKKNKNTKTILNVKNIKITEDVVFGKSLANFVSLSESSFQSIRQRSFSHCQGGQAAAPAKVSVLFGYSDNQVINVYNVYNVYKVYKVYNV